MFVLTRFYSTDSYLTCTVDRNINPDYYDYAVLQIAPLSTAHLPIALTSDTQHGLNSRLSIVAYFDDKPKKTKWMTSCKVS